MPYLLSGSQPAWTVYLPSWQLVALYTLGSARRKLSRSCMKASHGEGLSKQKKAEVVSVTGSSAPAAPQKSTKREIDDLFKQASTKKRRVTSKEVGAASFFSQKTASPAFEILRPALNPGHQGDPNSSAANRSNCKTFWQQGGYFWQREFQA